MRLEQAFWDDADVQRLTSDQQVEIQARYGGGEEPGAKPSAADISVVVVAREEDGAAVGCGALRALDGDAGEVKRMYVVPAARGRGVSKAVLAALEAAARERGWTTLRLETGPLQPEAVGLYRGAGFERIGAFGSYVGDPGAADSLFFEKVLGPV